MQKFGSQNIRVEHMRHIMLYIISCICFFNLIACSPSVNEQLHKAELLLADTPDSSLYILQKLQENYPRMNNEEKALFGLIFFQASDKVFADLPSLEFIDFSIDYYNKNNQKQQLAYCYLYRSRAFKYKRDYQNAIQNLLRAKELTHQDKDHSILGRIYFDLAQISGYQEEFKKAEKYYETAKAHFEKAGEKENIVKMQIAQGWLCMAIEDFDSAIRLSKEVLKSTSDSILMGDALTSIGTCYYYKDNFDSAIYYTRQGIQYPYVEPNISSRYYHLGNIYSFLNEYDSAAFYINKALQYPIDIYFEEECYRVLVKIALDKNNKKDLTTFMTKRQECQDSIKRLEQQTNINVLEKIHWSDVETATIKKQRIWLIVFIVGLVLTGCIIFLRLHKYNKQKQLKAEMYKIEHAVVQKKYTDTKIKADIYKTELKKKHELQIKDLKNDIEKARIKYALQRKNAPVEQRENLDRIMYNEVLFLDNEKAFLLKMNKALNNLPEKLKLEYPDINYKEIIWCCLFCMQFSTPEIALMLGFKQSTQYKFKQRLSKKLNFNSIKELEEMLDKKMNV